MPNYDFRCVQCAHLFEAFLPLARYRDHPICPQCGAATEKAYLPRSQDASSFHDPIVVYRAPDGSYRFPGATGGSSTAHYDALGYQRVECHNAADVRRLERSVNQQEASKLALTRERREAEAEQTRTERRKQLAHEMGRMSPAGRDLARLAIERNNTKDARKRTGEPGFRVDVMS